MIESRCEPESIKIPVGSGLGHWIDDRGTALIKANKVTTTSVERTPMPVAATSPIGSKQPSFTREANYLGVIRAGSDSAVGFEVAGVLTSLTATEGMRVSPGEVLAQFGTDRRKQADWTPPPRRLSGSRRARAGGRAGRTDRTSG